VGRVTDGLFWTAEGQARTEERFRRGRERARKQVWLSLKLRWVITLTFLAALVVGVATPATGHPFGRQELSFKIAAAALLLTSVLIRAVNAAIVRRRLNEGWQPVIGVHTLAVDDASALDPPD
jgi:uncharacterized membrane protein HdeD (DUF308 family)